jgi:hypothetical protein
MTNDDELIERLRRIAEEIDAPPELVAETARAAFLTRRLDEELAELLRDSDHATSQLVRGETGGPRVLSFETAAVSLELQIEEAAGRITLSGVVSGSSGEATIETTAAEPRTSQIDESGWFRVEDLPTGALRVHVTAADGRAVTTSWIRT